MRETEQPRKPLLARPGRAVAASGALSVVAVVAVVFGLLHAHGTPAHAPAVHHAAAPGHPDTFVFLWHLFMALALIGVLASLAGRLARRLGQPAIIGELFAGIAIGPSGLEALAPGAVSWVLSPPVVADINLIGSASLLLYMFAVGREFDPRWFDRTGKLIGLASVAMVAVPFAAGLVGSLPVQHELRGVHADVLPYALFVGTALSVTAFPVLARIVMEAGLSRSRLGALAMISAAGSDALAWAALAITVAFADAGSVGQAVLAIIGAGAAAVVLLVVVRPLLPKLLALIEHRRPLVAPTVAVVLGLIFGLAAFTQWLGVHAILGAFLAGLVLPRDKKHISDIPERMHSLNCSLLLPVYFLSVGLQVDIVNAVQHLDILGPGLLLLALAVVSKVGACLVIGRFGGLDGRTSVGLSVLMNARGVTEIVVLGVGLSAGLITEQAYTVLVVMALLTTVLVVPVLRRAGIVPRTRLRSAPPPIAGRTSIPIEGDRSA